jgi:hypothetical protein
MVFFADISNEELKSMGLNFTGANWVNFFYRDQNPNWRILQGPKAPFTLIFIILYIKFKNKNFKKLNKR